MSDAKTDEVLEWSTERNPDDVLAPPQHFMDILHSDTPMRRVRIWDGSEPWLVTKYDDYRIVAAKDSIFSADKSREGFPLKNEGYVSKKRTMLTMDDPEHMPYRRLWAKHLSAPKMEKFRPRFQEIVDEGIDNLLKQDKPADFVEHFALPVPGLVFAEVFGLPEGDIERFVSMASVLGSSKSTAQETAQALVDMREYAEVLIQDREANPRDDVITHFLHDGVGSGLLTREDLQQTIVGLVSAAYDSSVSLIAYGTLALINHPDQMQLLIENSDDPKFVANATEELLRFISPTQTGRRRIAIVDTELGGNKIKAGEGVIAMDSVASRDPDKFPNPNKLDLTRPEARRHNAFGFGTHQCAGQSLARVELQVVYATLYKRIPTLQLAVPESEIEIREDTIVYGIDSMPVTW